MYMIKYLHANTRTVIQYVIFFQYHDDHTFYGNKPKVNREIVTITLLFKIIL